MTHAVNLGSSSNKPVLELVKIKRTYGTDKAVAAGHGVAVLQGVDLALYAGQAVAIVGPSGSGKSTLLQIAGLLDAPDAKNGGEVKIHGEVIGSLNDAARSALRNRHCGYVYQAHHLLREFTALENVMMPATISRACSVSEAERRAKELLGLVGLEKRMEHFPDQLSGGEQQRVALARALMNRPNVLLADEPTGNLDPHTAENVAELLFKLIKHEGMAALIVTHNPELAAKCDRVMTMHDGRLVEGKRG